MEKSLFYKCSKGKCQNPAIIHQKYSGLHLCEPHFIEDVERKVKKEIRKQWLIEHGDTIAVAMSGGKDSSALLYLLKKFFHSRTDLEFISIAVDEGIKGFRSVTLRNAEKIAKELGVELFTFSFKKEFGFTLDEIAAKGFEQAPCTFCGVLRRKVIDRKAKELGATKVATAHNLDDEVQTILINYIRGDIARLSRLRGRRNEFVPRIKPLRGVPEKEVALYALVAGIPISTVQCPYVKLSFRFTVKRMLNEFEMKHPGTKYSLMRGYERMSEFLPKEGRELLKCERCGEASASIICKACEIVERMRDGKN
ncbi:MAG: TIGR00269 family protein [Methanophagales archaeon]|nr:TIGR00269 family protein [Methanophagales archaeon]RLG32983.1 MAG: TIGR00269 family protein [Methanosarcinales archaeon]